MGAKETFDDIICKRIKKCLEETGYNRSINTHLGLNKFFDDFLNPYLCKVYLNRGPMISFDLECILPRIRQVIFNIYVDEEIQYRFQSYTHTDGRVNDIELRHQEIDLYDLFDILELDKGIAFREKVEKRLFEVI